jgi:hypothetical protein
MDLNRLKRPSLVDRIDALLTEAGRPLTTWELARKLWPPQEKSRAWRVSSNGGPHGWVMPLGAAIRRGGFLRTSNGSPGSYSDLVYPRS